RSASATTRAVPRSPDASQATRWTVFGAVSRGSASSSSITPYSSTKTSTRIARARAMPASSSGQNAAIFTGRSMDVLDADGRGDPATVPSGITPEPFQRPGALQEEVQVVLDGVADAAVALQRFTADEVRRVGGHRLGHRH